MNKNNGFTLVELSIVLVIIGLLIGGILAAQSMVETSRVQALNTQLAQFDAGVFSFHAKYNGLPGDAKLFGGDGDAAIESHNDKTSYDGNMNAHSGEMANFWSQVFPGEYKAGTYTIGNASALDMISTTGANKSAPTPKLGRINSAFIASTYATPVATEALTLIIITQSH